LSFNHSLCRRSIIRNLRRSTLQVSGRLTRSRLKSSKHFTHRMRTSLSVPQLAVGRRFARSLPSYACGVRQNNLAQSASSLSQRWSSSVWRSGKRNSDNSREARKL
jgi:hypothetical protein